MKTPLAFIVEDDRELGQIISLILSMANCDTEIIGDGRLALGRIVERIPDIVLLDMHLPGISGREILRQIRADPHLRHIKVVVVTADALLIRDVEDDADLVLTKPVSVDQIYGLTTRLLHSAETAAHKTVPNATTEASARPSQNIG